jgi:hypothetical protein
MGGLSRPAIFKNIRLVFVFDQIILDNFIIKIALKFT